MLAALLGTSATIWPSVIVPLPVIPVAWKVAVPVAVLFDISVKVSPPLLSVPVMFRMAGL